MDYKFQDRAPCLRKDPLCLALPHSAVPSEFPPVKNVLLLAHAGLKMEHPQLQWILIISPRNCHLDPSGRYSPISGTPWHTHMDMGHLCIYLFQPGSCRSRSLGQKSCIIRLKRIECATRPGCECHLDRHNYEHTVPNGPSAYYGVLILHQESLDQTATAVQWTCRLMRTVKWRRSPAFLREHLQLSSSPPAIGQGFNCKACVILDNIR